MNADFQGKYKQAGYISPAQIKSGNTLIINQ